MSGLGLGRGATGQEQGQSQEGQQAGEHGQEGSQDGGSGQVIYALNRCAGAGGSGDGNG
jgi:hypothetical protein